MIQAIATGILQDSLLAVADLRRKYNGEKMITRFAGAIGERATSNQRCPLCVFQLETWGKYPRGEDDCDCLWYWLEGHGCEEWDGPDGDLVSFDDFTIPERLERLDRWEAAINEELTKRTP